VTSVDRTDSTKAFFFFIGDEGFYAKIKAQHVQDVIGDNLEGDLDSAEILRSLRSKFHLFLIHKPYWDKTIDAKQVAKWKAVLGAERVLELVDPKSVVDIMLGAIAIVGQTRTLSEYIEDLESRGQTPERIADIRRALGIVYEKLNTPTYPGPGETESDTPPKQFLCPITQDLMKDPVKCSDGNSYEREAIEFWLSAHNESPVTGLAFPSKNLEQNTALKQAIETWKAKHS